MVSLSSQPVGEMTMMTKSEPRAFEVWRLAFVYEDQPDVIKERPTIVGVVDSVHGFALVVKLTSHGPRPEFPGEIRIVDWKQAGLEKPSTARCSKTMLVPLGAFEGARRYGALSQGDADAIESALRSLGKIV